MFIGEVAERTGVTTKALRFYERQGLLHEPERTDGGYRTYGDDAVERVLFIRDAQAAGFSLRQVGEILAIRDRGEAPCEHVEALVERRLAEVEERLHELRLLRGQLRDIAARARVADPTSCDGYCDLITNVS